VVFISKHSAIAVQRIRSTVNEREQKQLLMDLDVIMHSDECPYIVKFYGALFKEVCFLLLFFMFSVWYCIKYWHQRANIGVTRV